MNVHELAEALKLLPDQEAMVVVRGYEDGVDEINVIYPTRLKLNAHDEWYYGQHEEMSSWNKDLDGYDTPAYHLAASSPELEEVDV